MTEAQAQELGPTGRPLRVYPDPAPLSNHGPARIISMVNQKGGVGKTTSTINLTVYNVMMDRKVDIKDVILPTGVENIDLLPANIDLSAAEVQLVNEVAREQVLASALRKVRDEYDVILIDCQPSLGLLTVNALTASEGVIIPLICEFFALRAVALLVDSIEKVQDRLNPNLEIVGVLATMFDARTIHSKEVLARIVDAFGDKVFDTVIKRTVKFPDASVSAEPILSYASSHPGAEAYRQVARELIYKGGAR